MLVVPTVFGGERDSSLVWVSGVFVVSFLLGVVFGLSAGLAAGLVGATLWWLLIERPGKATGLRGAVFGLVTVFFAHVLMWLIGPWIFPSVLSQHSLDPFTRAWATAVLQDLVFGLMLSLIVGVITIPIGVLAGMGLARIRAPID